MCDLETIQANLCTSGIGKVNNPITLKQIIAQLLCNSSIPPPVADFISRAGITDQTQIDAVTSLYNSAVSNGWWDKCDLIYPFVGGTALAHSQNLKSNSFTITWHGTVTHDANGITGNGVSGYGFTNYVPSSDGVKFTLNSVHIFAYKRTPPSIVGRVYFGSGTSLFGKIEMSAGATASAFGAWSVNSFNILATNVISLGGFCTNRVNSSTANLYYETSAVNASSAVGASLPDNNLAILCRNAGSPSVSAFCDVNLAAFTVGGGLVQAEFLQLNADWQAFQTALGRQV